ALHPALYDGARGGPHVVLGIERAGDAFDLHHGFLQHDQLWAQVHAEEVRDVEELEEQAAHGDAVGALAEDGLADGAQGLSEFLYGEAIGDVACFLMYFGDAFVIAAEEPVEDLREVAALFMADAAHDAEIDDPELAVAPVDEVALVHVGVEEA